MNSAVFFCFSSTIAAYSAAIFAAATLANYDSSFYRIYASSRTQRSRSRAVRPRFNSTNNLETTTRREKITQSSRSLKCRRPPSADGETRNRVDGRCVFMLFLFVVKPHIQGNKKRSLGLAIATNTCSHATARPC